jgi:hypothetical protein
VFINENVSSQPYEKPVKNPLDTTITPADLFLRRVEERKKYIWKYQEGGHFTEEENGIG